MAAFGGGIMKIATRNVERYFRVAQYDMSSQIELGSDSTLWNISHVCLREYHNPMVLS